VQDVSFSAFWSPMTLMHEPRNVPLPVKLSGFPVAVAATWKVVFPPLVVALVTK
jgi:hypothetical protein